MDPEIKRFLDRAERKGMEEHHRIIEEEKKKGRPKVTDIKGGYNPIKDETKPQAPAKPPAKPQECITLKVDCHGSGKKCTKSPIKHNQRR